MAIQWEWGWSNYCHFPFLKINKSISGRTSGGGSVINLNVFQFFRICLCDLAFDVNQTHIYILCKLWTLLMLTILTVSIFICHP